MEIREFEIPVPWGHVAVKAWGNKKDIPILVFHGFGDNAGSFDRLLPFLPTAFYYICIDFPNHGKSSPYPALLVTILDDVYTIKLLVEYLDRKKYILMGHSWGSQAVVLFNQLYPQYVTKLILLESLYPFPTSINEAKVYLTTRVNSWIKLNNGINESLLYTYEEAISSMCNNRLYGKLSREAAKPILKRVLIPDQDEKFMFSNHSHMKRYVRPLLFEIAFAVDLMKMYPINCPALFVYGPETQWFIQFNYASIVKILKSNKHCIMKETVGDDHDLHNNHPEIIAPIVAKFLNNMECKM